MNKSFVILIIFVFLSHKSLGKNFVPDATWQKKQNQLLKDQRAKELGLPLLMNDPILDERDLQKAEWEKQKQTEKEKNRAPDDFETFFPQKESPPKSPLPADGWEDLGEKRHFSFGNRDKKQNNVKS